MLPNCNTKLQIGCNFMLWNAAARKKATPLRLTTFASSPKGTPLRYAENFPATAKSRPLGEGGLTRSGKTEGVFPQRRAFAESGAATAVHRYDPTCENGVQKRPQAFLNPEI